MKVKNCDMTFISRLFDWICFICYMLKLAGKWQRARAVHKQDANIDQKVDSVCTDWWGRWRDGQALLARVAAALFLQLYAIYFCKISLFNYHIHILFLCSIWRVNNYVNSRKRTQYSRPWRIVERECRQSWEHLRNRARYGHKANST